MPLIFCVLEDGGHALLTRAQGNIQVPSFPTVGLLSSVAAFTTGAGYVLDNVCTEDVQVVYKK